MSKLIEQIKRITSGLETPIGFKKQLSDAVLSSMLLIVDVSNRAEMRNGKGINIDADALVINSTGLDPLMIRRFISSNSNIPVGIRCGRENSPVIGGLIDEGIDFVIFDLTSKINGLDKEGLGKVLEINKPLTTGMIKAVNNLNMSIDGVMLENDTGAIDIELLLQCHSYTDILSKPLIINIANTLSVTELIELSNANVRAFILSADMPSAKIEQVRSGVSTLPKLDKKKISRSPLIPGINNVSISEEAEEEDDLV